MKTLLIGRRHNATDFELIAGPTVSHADQVTIREALMVKHPVSDKWSELWLISAEEHIKHKVRFNTPASHDAAKKEMEADEAEYKASRATAEKLQQERINAEDAESKKAHDKQVAELNKQHDELRNSYQPRSKVADAILAGAGKQKDS